MGRLAVYLATIRGFGFNVQLDITALSEDISGYVRQVRGDAHMGLERARARVFGSSLRCTDFSHLIGANRVGRAKTADTAGPGPEADFMSQWRRGIFENCRVWLQAEEQLKLITSAVFASRSFPRVLFHYVWSTLLDYLQESGEGKCAEQLLKYYTDQDRAALDDSAGQDSAREQFWVAEPGKLAPTSPQGQLEKARRTVPSFVSTLRTFLSTRAEAMAGQSELLHDVPGMKWDSVLVLGPLDKFDRTPAQVYVQEKAFQKCTGEDGTAFYCMRKTLQRIFG